MKTYVLMISKTFMKSHPRGGQLTYFRDKIEYALTDKVSGKIHTIRGNYDLWSKRADEINAGKAILSVRQWTKSPYNYERDGSKQQEFIKLNKIGVQQIKIVHWAPVTPSRLIDGRAFQKECVVDRARSIPANQIAKNDGLNYPDFYDWFKDDFEGCIIHFTDFRY